MNDLLLRVEALVQRIAATVARHGKQLVGLGFMAAAALIVGIVWWLHRHTIAVFEPRGPIAHQERSLLFVALILSVIVVVPVFVLTIAIVAKYRDSNSKPAKYQPEWDGSRVLESIWWGVPGVIIVILSVITWNSSHTLDPYRALASGQQPLRVQVVSMDWKWLFIYPDQHIASVNYLPIPVNRPVNFELTSASVMNSFWIPQLGGQIYTMPGMSTQLHLMASQAGDYDGFSANIAGKGFADMHFKTHAVNSDDFQAWVQQVQFASKPLDSTNYAVLVRPAIAKQATSYSEVSSSLYDDIMMPFMMSMSMHTANSGSNDLLMTPMTDGGQSDGPPSNPDGTMLQ